MAKRKTTRHAYANIDIAEVGGKTITLTLQYMDGDRSVPRTSEELTLTKKDDGPVYEFFAEHVDVEHDE